MLPTVLKLFGIFYVSGFLTLLLYFLLLPIPEEGLPEGSSIGFALLMVIGGVLGVLTYVTVSLLL